MTVSAGNRLNCRFPADCLWRIDAVGNLTFRCSVAFRIPCLVSDGLSPAFHAVDRRIDHHHVLFQLPFGGCPVPGCGRDRASVGENVVGGDLRYGGFLRRFRLSGGGLSRPCFIGMFHGSLLDGSAAKVIPFPMMVWGFTVPGFRS